MPKPRRPLDRFEAATVVHLGVYLVASAWILGGYPPGSRVVLSAWGSLAPLILLAAALDREHARETAWRTLRWLWPLALFNALVLVSCLTRNVRELHYGATVLLAPVPTPAWLPTTTMPDRSLFTLWWFDAMVLSAFNLLVFVRHRRALRMLIQVVFFNALVLSVFGTVQRLVDAKGLFFGLIPSPSQPFFFASFNYHNHWSGYIIAAIMAGLGLAWHYIRRHGPRGLRHTPALVILASLPLLALTEPLSGSRSGTLLLVPVAAIALPHWLSFLVQRRRRLNESVAGPILVGVVAAAAVAAATWYVAGDVIRARLTTTQQQLAVMREEGGLGSRSILYHDTWRMARAKLWYGWGMESFPYIFSRFNSQRINPVDGLATDYSEAHNDWLQSAAEHGLVGSLLLGLVALVPLAGLRWRRPGGVLPAYLLLGCILLLLYAVVEFPFGCTAVALIWWVYYFGSLQYALLTSRSRTAAPAAVP
jgi:O-antigen ligase